jgi:hypothetical protein
MIVLYYLARLLLSVLHLLVRYRTARLEKRYVRLAAEADTLLKASQTRGGTNKPDPCNHAKQQYALAQVALKRDRVENRFTSWQKFSERFGTVRRGLASYRGRLLPYVFGLVDVATVAVVLSHFEIGVTEVRSMIGI